jgi:succinate dehydrogenase / fumarate reductase cytochrome b subunit
MSDQAFSELPGSSERAERGPVHHKGPGPRWSGWLDPRGRTISGRSFALHRITGLALLVYLYLHLGVLSMLLVGKSAWSDFLSVFTSKGALAFDVVLLFGVVFHGLNGIRVALVGSGIGVRYERAMLWVVVAITVPTLVFIVLHVFGAL